jgi:hypothetical protein
MWLQVGEKGVKSERDFARNSRVTLVSKPIMSAKIKARRGAKVRDLNPRKDAKGGRRHHGAHAASGARKQGATLSTGNSGGLGHPLP